MRITKTMKNNHFFKKISCIFVFYLLVSILLYLHFRESLYINMVWNIFLAYLPLLFAILMSLHYEKLGCIKKVVLGVPWLIFFPNSPYMMTDMIHISGNNFFLSKQKYNQIIFSTDMTLWIRIVYIGLGLFIGMLSGMLSLHLIHNILRKQFGSIISNIVILGTCVLSGYGIYLGRFLRLNSWNLIQPSYFLARLSVINPIFSYKFTLLYAFFVYTSYLIFCAFYQVKQS